LTYQLEYKREGSGFWENGLAGETLGDRKLVYLDTNGLWRLADSDDASKMPSLGVTIGGISNGKYGRILTQGYIGDPDWSWTVGASLYACVNAGELTETQPTSGEVQVVAHAKEGDLIYLFPWESEDAAEETPSSHGKLVSVNETGDNITVTTAGTWYQHTAIDGSAVTNMTYDALGEALQMNYNGEYLVSLATSISVDAADHRVHIGIGVNGTVGAQIQMDYTAKFANRISNVGFTTIAFNLTAGDDLTVEVTSDTDGDVVKVYHCQLTAVLLIET